MADSQNMSLAKRLMSLIASGFKNSPPWACFLPAFYPTNKQKNSVPSCRHRSNMIAQKADTSHKMQKYLKLLNFRLDVVVRDITGLTGMKIIADICAGNLDPRSLAKHRHYNCRKSEEEIAKAVGNLKDSDLGKFFKKIAFRKGRQAAITATARKIAVIIWNMITKKQAY